VSAAPPALPCDLDRGLRRLKMAAMRGLAPELRGSLDRRTVTTTA
jgi:hypothetical protein